MRVAGLQNLLGALLGGALGDSLGLPFEGLHPQRVAALWPQEGLHFGLPGGAWISDDTEHAFFTGLALLRFHQDGSRDPEKFGAALLGHFRSWFLALPPALGMATARSGFWSLLGLSHQRTGVFSAGNGPLMRAPVIGASWSGSDLETLDQLVDISTRLTHTDPIVLRCARVTARLCATPWEQLQEVLEAQLSELPEGPTRLGLEEAWAAAGAGSTGAEYAARAGHSRGVSGFAPQSLGAALFAALSHPGDVPAVLETTIRLGGDTDTVGALAGALAGSWFGPGSLPEEWVAGLESPLVGVRHLRALARGLTDPEELSKEDLALLRQPSWLIQFPRNMGFLAICLTQLPRRWLSGRLG